MTCPSTCKPVVKEDLLVVWLYTHAFDRWHLFMKEKKRTRTCHALRWPSPPSNQGSGELVEPVRFHENLMNLPILLASSASPQLELASFSQASLLLLIRS
jgi:hypothetical protein